MPVAKSASFFRRVVAHLYSCNLPLLIMIFFLDRFPSLKPVKQKRKKYIKTIKTPQQEINRKLKVTLQINSISIFKSCKTISSAILPTTLLTLCLLVSYCVRSSSPEELKFTANSTDLPPRIELLTKE